MRILQINKFFYRRGGADVHFLDLGRLLESHGHQVIYFSALNPANEPSPYSQYFVKNIEMRRHYGLWPSLKIAGHILYSREAKQKLEALVKKTKPEMAHLHNIYHHLSPSILPILKKYKIPVVMTLHDYKLICPNYRLYTEGKICERCQKHRYYQAIFHRSVLNRPGPSALAALEMSFHKLWGVYKKDIDLFISPSRFLKEKFMEWGWDGSKIKLLPNFVPHPVTLNPKAATCLSRRQGGKSQPYFLYFGRLVEEKGVLTLIKAMQKLPEISLRMVGDGPLQERLNPPAGPRRQKTSGAAKAGNLTMVGYQSGEKLAAEIAGARAIVIPSEWYENCPLSVLEAMSYGQPVIASRLGGLPELVRDGRSGLLFKAGDAADLAEKIKMLWSDEKLARQMGEKARRQVLAENDPERYYQRLTALYQSLI